MKRNIAKQMEYQKKYLKKKRMITILLDNKKDADIISWMERQENKSDAIREVLRKHI